MAGRMPSRQLDNFSPDRSPLVVSQGYPASAAFAPLPDQRRVFSDFPEGDFRGDQRAPPPQQMEPLVGVGIVFRRNPQTRAFVVDRMYQDGPALRSQNVAQGDVLITVDQHPVEDVNSQRLHDLIAGRVGSTVTLGLQCDDGKFREVTLRRAHCTDIEPPRRISSPPSSYAPASRYDTRFSCLLFTSTLPFLRYNAPYSPMEDPESSGAEEEDEADAGIGITFKKLESGLFFVGKIVSGGPAARMGTQIQVQDILYKVDNAEVKGWDYKELANRIKGPAGSVVTMHFRRSGKPPHKATVTRGHITEKPVSMRGKAVKGASSSSSSSKRGIQPKFSPKDGECGIGFAVKSDGDKGFFISKILPDSPAMECGRLHVGDRVRKIDGQRIEGMSLDRVKSLILGEEGSAMDIVITDQQVRTYPFLHICLANC
jgi:C-terminal processing protease CtpA/Prc